MWIKSLDDDVWVNMIHITTFSIVERGYSSNRTTHEVYAFLDTSSKIFNPFDLSSNQQEQASVIIYRGSHEECEVFVKEKTFLQVAFQWIGYLVAGGVGAVITLIFT